MNIKYYGKILSYLIAFVLILILLVGLNDITNGIDKNCNSCIVDKKNIDNYQNINTNSPDGSVSDNTNIMSNLNTNNAVAGNNSFGRVSSNIADTPANTGNNKFGRVPSSIDNNTENSFNNFMDNQSKENEKIIINYLTSKDDEFYTNNYINYQKNGHELSDIETSLKENIWRASIGNQNVVQPFLKDAKKYYQDILTRGVNNSPPDEMLKNYMESAEYNYIVPLNEGMVNPEYTYVSPSNWNFLNLLIIFLLNLSFNLISLVPKLLLELTFCRILQDVKVRYHIFK